MTKPCSPPELAQQIAQKHPGTVEEIKNGALVVSGQTLLGVARFLKDTPGLDFDYLASVTGVDYLDYFEVVYHLVSMTHNHSAVLKVRLPDRQAPTLPSVVGVWRGAELQEREVYDLMGISFTGHPNLKRVFLWEGFPGHPLRKDFFY